MMTTPSQLTLRLGFWAATVCAAAFVLFTVCFVLLVVVQPLFIWQDMAGYLDFAQTNSQLLPHVARLCALVFALGFVVLLHAVVDAAPADKRVWAHLSLSFGLGFAVLVGINYFVQLTAVRLTILHEQTTGLEQVVQANPYSAVAAINLLGWTLFLGLSSLFAAPLFAGSRLACRIRWLFIANGGFCLTAALAYAFDWLILLFLTINIGMGGATTTLVILLALFFRRQLRQG